MSTKTAQNAPAKGNTTAAGFLNRRPQVRILSGSLRNQAQKSKPTTLKLSQTNRASPSKKPHPIGENVLGGVDQEDRGADETADPFHASKNQFRNKRRGSVSTPNPKAVRENLACRTAAHAQSMERRRAKASRLHYAGAWRSNDRRHHDDADQANPGSARTRRAATGPAHNLAHVCSASIGNEHRGRGWRGENFPRGNPPAFVATKRRSRPRLPGTCPNLCQRSADADQERAADASAALRGFGIHGAEDFRGRRPELGRSKPRSPANTGALCWASIRLENRPASTDQNPNRKMGASSSRAGPNSPSVAKSICVHGGANAHRGSADAGKRSWQKVAGRHRSAGNCPAMHKTGDSSAHVPRFPPIFYVAPIRTWSTPRSHRKHDPHTARRVFLIHVYNVQIRSSGRSAYATRAKTNQKHKIAGANNATIRLYKRPKPQTRRYVKSRRKQCRVVRMDTGASASNRNISRNRERGRP